VQQALVAYQIYTVSSWIPSRIDDLIEGLSQSVGERRPVLLAPADLLLSIPPLMCPVIGYGPADSLDSVQEHHCSDFLAEPWADAELRYRVRRVARSIISLGDGAIEWGPNWLVGLHRSADPVRTTLTAGEYHVLELLALAGGRVVSRARLLQALGQAPDTPSRALDMRVSRLRRRLAEVSASWLRRPGIGNVRGEGYQLTVS
jgi:hypothetical protein